MLDLQVKNKLKKILPQLRGFKFVRTLVLVFTKNDSEDKTKYDTFYSHSKAETIINESDIDGVFILQLYQTYKNIEKVRAGSLIQS